MFALSFFILHFPSTCFFFFIPWSLLLVLLWLYLFHHLTLPLPCAAVFSFFILDMPFLPLPAGVMSSGFGRPSCSWEDAHHRRNVVPTEANSERQKLIVKAQNVTVTK